MGISLFSPKTKNTTKIDQHDVGQTSDQKGTGHGSVAGDSNTQQLGSTRAQVGRGNRKQVTSGLANAGNVGGNRNRQNVGRGNAFQGADFSQTHAEGPLKNIGSHSSIGGDLVNRDYNLELVAEGGSKITFEQGDSGVTEAIADLGRALGKTSTTSTVQVGDALKRQQIGEISKEVLYAIGALILGSIFLRNRK